MKQLRASNEILGDGRAFWEAMNAEGYVYFRNVIDQGLIRQLKHGVMAWFEAEGYAKVIDDEPVWTGVDPSVLGEHPPALYTRALWEWLALRPEMQDLYERAFGEKGRLLPAGEYQFTWPGRPNCWTRLHQDGPYNPGLDFLVLWIPLMAIDEPLGGLAIVPTAQARGSLHPSTEQDADSQLIPFIPAGTFGPDAWHRADYEPGDALFFGAWTPHCGMPNETDRLRLSVDLRMQPSSARRPITGVVIDEAPGRVVIAADSGHEIPLTFDSGTAMPLLDRDGLLGRRVLATSDAGRALLIRNQRGHVPWQP